MSTPAAIDTVTTTGSTTSDASTTSTSSSLPITSSTTTTTTTTSSTSDAASTTSTASSALIDDSDDYDSQPNDDIALRSNTKRRTSLTHGAHSSTTSSSSASSGAPSILRGLSMKSKAVQSTLSKGLSVALQYTKEKIGQANDVTQEEDSFTQHIDYTRTTTQHLKSLTITLQSLIASQHTAILAHDAFAATIKKVATNHAAAPLLTTPRSGGGRGESGGSSGGAAGGLAAIEEMTAAFTEGAGTVVAAVKGDDDKEDEKTAARSTVVDDTHKASLSSAPSNLTVHTAASPSTTAGSTVNLIPAFYPYTRRHLSGRLIVSDSYSSLLNSIQTLQAATAKAAQAAIQQLEIDRLHYDACQNNLRLLTTPTPTNSNTVNTAPPTPHASDPTLSDDKRRLEHERLTLTVDSAHLTYLRSKAAVEERVEELRVKVRDVLERGLSVIVAIERYEVEAARALLTDERAGRELSMRKKTNPAAMGIRRSGKDDGEDEEHDSLDVASAG